MRVLLQRCLQFWIVSWFSFFSIATQGQTLSLADLPYRDPRPLVSLLALDEMSFSARILCDWPRISNMLTMFVPVDARITPASLFFSTTSQRCMQQREPAACRLYMDFLSFQMKQKRAAPASTGTPMPIVLRPAQLPSRNTAVLNALAVLDASNLQSALASHWDWLHQVIERFLPDHFSLYPISKVFTDIRATCQSARTEVACRMHLSDVDSMVDHNLGQPSTLFRTLEQVPYRAPAPLDSFRQLNEAQWRTQTNQGQLDALLNRYIGWSVAIVGDVDFARARLDCQVVTPGDGVRCRDYLDRLARLMRSKQRSVNPFTPFGLDASRTRLP